MFKIGFITLFALSFTLAGCNGSRKAPTPAAAPAADQANEKKTAGDDKKTGTEGQTQGQTPPVQAQTNPTQGQNPTAQTQTQTTTTQGQTTQTQNQTQTTTTEPQKTKASETSTDKADEKKQQKTDEVKGDDSTVTAKTDDKKAGDTGDKKPEKKAEPTKPEVKAETAKPVVKPEAAKQETKPKDANPDQKKKDSKASTEPKKDDKKADSNLPPVAHAESEKTEAAKADVATLAADKAYEVVACQNADNGDLMAAFNNTLQNAKVLTTAKEAVKIALAAMPNRPMAVIGENATLVDNNCSPATLEKALLEAKTTEQYADISTKYVEKCGATLSTFGAKGVKALATVAKYQYPICDAKSSIKSVSIELATKWQNKKSQKLFGTLALRPGNIKRPLVVIKCGVFCNAGNTASARDYLMQYFDQSPFHVLLLGNRTGDDYIKANGIFSVGGYEEAAELIHVGKWIKTQKGLMDKVSSLHLAGISLGGNAALFGAKFNEKENHVFESVTAICPVVDLKSSLNAQFSNAKDLDASTLVGTPEEVKNRVVATGFYELFKIKLNNSKAALDVGNQINPSQTVPAEKMTEYIADLAVSSLNLRLDPKDKVQKNEAWYRMNDFIANYNGLSTPTLVIAASDDSIVKTELNSARLKAAGAAKKDSNLGVVIVPTGDHCAFSAAYGAKFASTFLRTHILNNSGEFKKSYTYVDTGVGAGISKDIKAVHVSQTVTFKVNIYDILLNLQIFDPSLDVACAAQTAFHALPKCYVNKTVRLDLSKFEKYGAKVPQTEVEAQQLTREFNSRLLFLVDTEKDKTSLLTESTAGKFHVMIRNSY